MFGKDDLLEAIQKGSDEVRDDINYRKCVKPIKGLESILSGVREKTAVYRKPYEQSSSIIFSIPGSVTIKLDTIHFLNYIEINFGNCEKSGYSYYIEVATHENEWFRIADYTDYYCYSTQTLYFKKVAIQYIRIYGTRCNGGGINFIIDSFKSMIKEIPSSVYQYSRNKNELELDFKGENKNKCHAPLYGVHKVNICKSKSITKSTFY